MHDRHNYGSKMGSSGPKPMYMPCACRHLTAAGFTMALPGQENIKKHGQREGGGQGGAHSIPNT